jgi:hypothetical protein
MRKKKDFVYNALKHHFGNTQISSRAVEEIQRFMNDSLNDLCKELKTKFEESNKRRKLCGLDEYKRVHHEIVEKVLYEKIEMKFYIENKEKVK